MPSPPEAGAHKLGAVVLAAGYSSRMVEFKPLLPFAGATVAEATIGLFRRAGIGDVLAVLGHRAEELRPVAEKAGARTVLNPRYDEGMYSSVRAAAGALTPGVDLWFVLPVDMPLVRAETLHRLAHALQSSAMRIAYPVFQGRRGHPPLIAREVLLEALDPSFPGPLFALLARHKDEACEVPVADEGIHLDLDTREEYARLYAMAPGRDIPTEAECEALLSIYCVTPQIVAHSRAVADVASELAAGLNQRGLNLDLALVRVGGLLHDIAKGAADHANAGAALLRAMDFERVAAITAFHTGAEALPAQIDETEVVFLADKIVRGASRVGIEERFRATPSRFEGNEEALAAAQRRQAKARASAARVEARLGTPLNAYLRLGGNIE